MQPSFRVGSQGNGIGCCSSSFSNRQHGHALAAGYTTQAQVCFGLVHYEMTGWVTATVMWCRCEPDMAPVDEYEDDVEPVSDGLQSADAPVERAPYACTIVPVRDLACRAYGFCQHSNHSVLLGAEPRSASACDGGM